MNAYIRSVGVYVPANRVTNDELVKQKEIDSSDEWIRTRSGILERRIEDDSSLEPSDLGVRAAEHALERAGMDASEIDGIIFGSLSPDKRLPASACILQKKLGIKNTGFAYDITTACAFYPFAMSQAALAIREGLAKNILIVGAELCSKLMDWSDRNTCVLFGDAAGAMIMSAGAEEGKGYISSALHSRGDLDEILYLEHTGEDDPYLRMEGRAVFKLAVTEVPKVVEEALAKAGLETADLDALVPHQANVRILESAAKRLGLEREKVMINLERYGNTSSASVPLVLFEALEEGKIKEGDLVAFVAIGAGMSWGSALFRW
jgi:3-oxoacyl-[acyl-carrier-protein] synthase-3